MSLSKKLNTTTNLNYRSLLINRKNLLIAIVMIAVSFIIVFFGILAQISQINDARAQIAKDQQSLDKLKKKLADLEQVSFDPDFQQRQVVFDALPSKKPLLEILNGLVYVVRDAQVVVSQLKLNPGLIASDSAELMQDRSKGSGKYGELRLELAVSGPFDNLQNFITRIEQMSPFTTVTKIRLSDESSGNRDKEESEIAKMRAQLEIHSYYFTQTVAQTLSSDLPKIEEKERFVLDELSSFVPPIIDEQLEISGGGFENFFDVKSVFDELINSELSHQYLFAL